MSVSFGDLFLGKTKLISKLFPLFSNGAETLPSNPPVFSGALQMSTKTKVTIAISKKKKKDR
jgi:hypothetical protein